MKAVAVFLESGKVELVDAPEPKIQSDTDVLVKSLAVGLCGTDREIVGCEHGEAPAGSDYLILGHECLGEVIEVGSAVEKFKPGQLVVPRVRRPCGSPVCRACESGRPDFCLTGQFTERGIEGAHGFMCERFVDHEDYFHLVPDHLRSVGVLTEPMTIAMKSFIQVTDVQQRLPYLDKEQLAAGDFSGMTALILGAGPVGMLGAMALVDAGSRVFVYSRAEEPNASSELIESCGGEYVSSDIVSPEQLVELTGPIDIMYEATGASQFSFEMASVLGRNGIYILTGVPGRKGPVPLRVDTLMRNMVLKNQLLIGTVNAGPPAFDSAIETLDKINTDFPGVLDRMITERVSPEDVSETLHAERERGTIKQVVEL